MIFTDNRWEDEEDAGKMDCKALDRIVRRVCIDGDSITGCVC